MNFVIAKAEVPKAYIIAIITTVNQVMASRRYRMFLLFVAVKTTEPPADVKRPDFSIVLISEQQASVMSAKFAENAATAVIMLITKAGFTEAISLMHAMRMGELLVLTNVPLINVLTADLKLWKHQPAHAALTKPHAVARKIMMAHQTLLYVRKSLLSIIFLKNSPSFEGLFPTSGN